MGVLDRYNEKKKKDEESKSKATSGGVAERYEKNKYYQTLDIDSVDEKYINSFMSDTNSFFSGVNEKSIPYGAAKNTLGDLSKRYDTIQGWLYKNKGKLNEEAYTSLSSTFDGLQSSFTGLKDFYSQWETEDDYNAAVEKWQKYYDEWGHYSDEADFEEYAGKGASIQNPAFSEAQGWGIGPWRFGNEDVGNIVTFSRDNYNDIVGYSEGGKYDVVGNFLYQNMTEDEVKMYNYLLAKQGKGAADSYLSYLEPQLKGVEGQRIGKLITDIDIPVIEDLAVLGYGFGAGLDQWASSARQFFTNEEQYPSVTQHANAYISESLDGFGSYAHQAATTIGNMAPSILVSSVTAGLGAPAAVAQGLGAATVGVSAAGNAYSDALSKGYDKGSARTYSTLVGASEGVLQYLIGGVSKLGGMSGKLASKIAAIDNSLLRISAKLGTSIGSEIFEEELQNYLEPVFRTWIFGEEYDMPTLDELVETAIVTAMSTGMLEGGGTIGGDIKNSKYYKSTYGDSVQDLVLQGIESPEGSLSHDLAAKYQARLDSGKTINGHQIGRMVEANEQQFRSEDMASIQSAAESRLAELGETGDVSAIAAALTKQAAGEKLSRVEQQAISNSKYGQRVANELDTENIQSGNYSSEWAQKLDTNRINVDEYSRLVEAAQLPQETAEVTGKLTGKESLQVAEESTATVRKNRIVETQPENQYEVSDDGKTYDNNNNEIVITGVESVNDGKMILKTESGTIDSRDVQYATGAEALVYEAVSKLGASPSSSWTMINGFKESDGVSAQDYATLLPLAYKYGKINYKNGLLNLDLTPKQSAIAFQMGREDAKASVKPTSHASTESTLSKKSADKKIIFDGFNYNEESATDIQKASMAAIDMVNKMSSLEIHVYQSVKKNGKRYAVVKGKERLAPNGYFTDGNKIYIDINAGNMGDGLMLYTLSHEIGHYIARYNAHDFKAISDFLFEHYGKNVPVDMLLDEQKKKLKKSYETDGKPVPSDAVLEKAAHEELVCDMLSRIMADKNAYDKLMELKQKDLNVFQKLGQAIKKVLDKIAKLLGIYDTNSPDFMYAASVENFGEEAFRQLQNLYIKAFVQADANFHAAEAQKNTTEDGGVKFMSREDSARIKSQISAVADKLNQMDAVDHVITDGFAGKQKSEIAKAVEAEYAKFGKRVDRQNFGIILLEFKQINKALEYLYTDGEKAALLTVPRVLKRGIIADTHTEHKERGVDSITFAAPVEINGVRGNVGVVVQRVAGTNRFKTLRILLPNGKAFEFVQNKEADSTAGSSSKLEHSEGIPIESASNASIRNENGIVKNESVEAMDMEVDEKTESVAPAILMSERTWTESDYVQEREQAAKEIAKAIGVSVKKAKAYIDSVNSIAKMIAEDRVRLDYFSSPGRSSFVSNVEYGGSFDFSTLCKKRRLLTGTFTAIQKALPNTALTADEILDIRNRMKDAGLEVSCGLCYVEGSRANMGQFAKEFLRLYKQYYPDAWQPNMADVNTPDGIEWVRINHPECYEQYEYFWNHYGTLKDGDKNLFASQQKPKLYQLHAEYKGEILYKFNDDDNVEEKNLNGGIRLQSFSDFEIVHLIDTMQIIMDMSRVGLAGQAYTKVPDFAWALGDTGLKINLSLIAKGVDENRKLIFNDVEGMPIAEAMKLRDRYSKNVGTILVAFNDEQLLAAMADDRVDFIIPFHRSQWKKSQYEAMGLPAKTKDYTYMQNEKFIKPQYHEYRGRMVKDKATNYMPNEYWDFNKSGKENAEAYLEMCARNNKRPKFYKLLQNNGDGSYSLKADGSTDGYWKLLIDFKMYDNDGNGSPQMPVKPEFNMDEAQKMMNDYQGGHSNFPVAHGIVDEFVQEYKKSHEGVQYSDRDSDSVSNRSLLANAFEGLAQNDIERNKIQEYRSKVELINAEERKLSELNEQIKELSFSKGPRDTKKIRDLQFEARQTANRINTYDKQLLRLEASKPLQDVLSREKKAAYQRAENKGKEALAAYKEKAAKTQRELLERWQDSRKKGIEGRHKTAMRHKIKDVVNELNQYLLRGTKDRHVPIELQKAVAEALDAVNMDTVGAEERIAKLKDELLKAKTPEQIQEISRKIDHIQAMGDKMNGRLQKLKDAYDQFVNSDDPLIANSHDEVISNKLQSVIDSIGNTPLRDMTLNQLEDVYDMYRMVLTTIRNANKAFKAKKSESISTIANQVMVEVEKVGGKQKQSLAMLNGIKSFGWNNLKPVYAFEHIGSDHFTDVFNNVRAGEDVWAVDVTEARKYYLDKSKKYNYDSWDLKKRHKFTSTSGMDFELDLEQIMSLYAYSKRDQAAEHLKKGGIVIDETTEITIKNKLGIPVKFNPTEATAYNISDETLADITSKLTNEQKAFVDEMQDYLSAVMGEKGNEVSLEMYGVKLFKEKFYFPLKSAQQFMAKAKEQAQGEVKIKNSGFSKETVQKASNPIVLTPFMNVWANHVNEMSMYHAFVLPMEDFYRVYNYKTPTSDTMATESVEMFIQNAYGKGATKYIDQLLKDLNGGARTDSTTGFINKMMGLFKKGAVFASLSVVVQQPSAVARAAALVDTKYFIGPKVDHKRHKALWNEVKQYAPVAIIKEMGYFDTNMGKSTQDFIMGKEYSGFKDKMSALVKDSSYRDEVLSKAPALADEVAWCDIWEAVKRETKAKNPGMDVKSEDFLKMAGERFTEVVTKTQVYDSVLSRSGLMRSKDTVMKMATAFMAEPTTSINMVADALLQGKRGSRKYARSAIGAVIASQILNSILVSFVYAGRDDDEDETYLEKYIGTLTGEVLDSLNPLTYIPFIKDIMSIIRGYDVERSDMAVVSDLWNAWENLRKDNVSAYRKVEGFAGSIAQIFGLPVKNIMRDARGIYQTIMSFVNGQQTTAAGIGYAVEGAITGKTESDQNQLYEAYLSGDSKHIARVEGRFKDQSAINTAMRTAIKDRYKAGEIDYDTAKQYLVEFGGLEEDDAYWKVEEWEYEKDSDDDFRKYNKFYEAVQTGKNLKAVIKEYTDNGVEAKTLASQITSNFKPLYKEMSNIERADIKGYLLNAYALLGYNRDEKSKDIDKWLKD